MPESAVDLHRKVKPLVAKTDIGTQNRFRNRLSRHITVLAILQADPSPVQIGNSVNISAVSVRNQPRAVRQVKHPQRLAHHLVNNVVVSAMKSGTVKACKTLVFGGGKHLTVKHAAQRKQFVTLESHVGINIQLHIPCFQRSDADSDFRPPVTHGAHIGK